MNTPTLITLVIFFVVIIWLLFDAVIRARRAEDQDQRRLYIAFAVLIVFIIGGLIITGLNTYGIGRLPLMNEVRSRIPESFTPAEKTINPPVNGQTQAPSQPTFDEHQKQMEKLKRDGL